MTEELEVLNSTGEEVVNRIKELPLFPSVGKKPFFVSYIKGTSLEKRENYEQFINFNYLVNELRRLEVQLGDRSDREQARLLRIELVNFAKININPSRVLLLSDILPQIVKLNSKIKF